MGAGEHRAFFPSSVQAGRAIYLILPLDVFHAPVLCPLLPLPLRLCLGHSVNHGIAYDIASISPLLDADHPPHSPAVDIVVLGPCFQAPSVEGIAAQWTWPYTDEPPYQGCTSLASFPPPMGQSPILSQHSISKTDPPTPHHPIPIPLCACLCPCLSCCLSRPSFSLPRPFSASLPNLASLIFQHLPFCNRHPPSPSLIGTCRRVSRQQT